MLMSSLENVKVPPHWKQISQQKLTFDYDNLSQILLENQLKAKQLDVINKLSKLFKYFNNNFRIALIDLIFLIYAEIDQFNEDLTAVKLNLDMDIFIAAVSAPQNLNGRQQALTF